MKKTKLQINAWVNRLIFYLLSVEASLIKMGVNFPVGGSWLVIAKKI